MVSKELKIHFFGDSICFGQGVSIIHGWVPRIAKNLLDIFSKKNVIINISNNAVNGRTTRQALESMPYEIQNSYPDILIIQFGMNDCNYWKSDNGVPRVNKDSFKYNLKEIIQRSEKFSTKKILLNTNHPTTRTKKYDYADISYQESNSIYNEMIREVASESERVILNDIEKKVLKKIKNSGDLSSLLLEDQLHLSIKGHDFYYNQTLKELKKIIEDLI